MATKEEPVLNKRAPENVLLVNKNSIINDFF